MKIRMGWIVAGFTFAMMLLIGAGWVSVRVAQQSTDDAVWVGHTQEVLGTIRSFSNATNELESQRRGYYISSDQAYLQRYSEMRHGAINDLARLRQLTADNALQQRHLDGLEPLLAQRLKVLDELIQSQQAKSLDQAGNLRLMSQGHQNQETILGFIRDMEMEEQQLLAERQANSTAAQRKTLETTTTSFALSLVLLAGVFLVLVRQVKIRTTTEMHLVEKAKALGVSEVNARQQHAILHSVLNNMSDGVVVADESGRFLFFNPAAEQLLGATRAEIQPAQWSEHYHVYLPDQTTLYPAADLPLARALRGEATDNVLLFVQHPKLGRSTWVEVSGRAFKQADGSIAGGLVVFRDVSERRSHVEELKRQKEELALSNADLEQFAYVASHDLQEPLRTVASYTELLAKRYRGKLDVDGEKFLRFVCDGAHRMQELIRGLLSWSLVTKHSTERSVVSMTDALRHALGNLQAATNECGARVTNDPLPEIIGDSVLLVQLFQNLIGNALKFRGMEEPRIHVSVERAGGNWTFSVKDNGIGINPEYSERIFQIFQRLHTREEYPGAGIGLSLSKKIVERLGGRIWFESAAGQGTTFFFSLPRKEVKVDKRELISAAR
jgi:PAS domain S-box-containing protein